jgi:peptide-methionine (S)-S-oxide reductase
MSIFDRYSKPAVIPTAEQALPGRADKMAVPSLHTLLKTPLQPPFPAGTEQVVFGMGCFWGAERKFWQQDGVYTTAVGYCGGHTPNPNYEEVCSGMTGHNEVVLVVFDPIQFSLRELLKLFWESHNPTEGMRQGNDVGTQYRSGIYCSTSDQQTVAVASLELYQAALAKEGLPAVTTEIVDVGEFYYAESYHQQYLDKNPGGYCGLGGTGVSCSL